MQRPPDVPPLPGVFMIAHAATKRAYVQATTNLKERSILWAHYLRHDNVRVAGWPDDMPDDELEFRFVSTDRAGRTLTLLREKMVREGWTLIGRQKKARGTLYRVDGVNATLIDHCRRMGIEDRWAVVYKRVNSGVPAGRALRDVKGETS